MKSTAIFLSFFFCFFFCNGVFSQSPTWSENIAPIIYTNCSSCHHDTKPELIRIINSMGQIINEIPIHGNFEFPYKVEFINISSGIYFVEMITNDRKYIGRIIKL